VQRPCGAAHVPLLHCLSVPAVRGPSDGPLLALSCLSNPSSSGLRRWSREICMLLVLLTACNQSQRPSFRSTDITGADFGKDFLVANFNGRERRIEVFGGKIVALFFGYPHCPDVCPPPPSVLAPARKKLGAEGDRLQVIFVTADPERDT